MVSAYMIRNDGVAFPVQVHLYGNPDDVEETIYACEWLYSHTKNESIKPLIIQLIATWAFYGEPECPYNKKPSNYILMYLNDCGYEVLSTKFLEEHSKEIDNAEDGDLEELNKTLVNELNQEFLRARYGGAYDTTSGSKDMWFRVSSTGFNWFNIIWEFVYNNRRDIRTVSIARDSESTGEDWFYKHNGDTIKLMPVEDFINLSGRPVVESLTTPLIEQFPKMNSKRRNDKIEKLKIKEIRENYIKI